MMVILSLRSINKLSKRRLHSLRPTNHHKGTTGPSPRRATPKVRLSCGRRHSNVQGIAVVFVFVAIVNVHVDTEDILLSTALPE